MLEGGQGSHPAFLASDAGHHGLEFLDVALDLLLPQLFVAGRGGHLATANTQEMLC